MGDSDIQSLERRFKESGDSQDEQAWLLAAARRRQLAPHEYLRLSTLAPAQAAKYLEGIWKEGDPIQREKIRLASLLGHDPARGLAPERGISPTFGPFRLLAESQLPDALLLPPALDLAEAVVTAHRQEETTDSLYEALALARSGLEDVRQAEAAWEAAARLSGEFYRSPTVSMVLGTRFLAAAVATHQGFKGEQGEGVWSTSVRTALLYLGNSVPESPQAFAALCIPHLLAL